MIPSYDERLKFYKGLPKMLRDELSPPVKGEYKKLHSEINKQIKDFSLNDLEELLEVIVDIKSGRYRFTLKDQCFD